MGPHGAGKEKMRSLEEKQSNAENDMLKQACAEMQALTDIILYELGVQLSEQMAAQRLLLHSRGTDCVLHEVKRSLARSPTDGECPDCFFERCLPYDCRHGDGHGSAPWRSRTNGEAIHN